MRTTLASILIVAVFVAVASADEPQLRFRIAPETTHITKPLKENGWPDYLAWLNQSHSKGVTPENNAFVGFLSVYGEKNVANGVLPRMLEHLGVDALREVPLLPFIDIYSDEARDADDAAEVDKDADLSQQLRSALIEPWDDAKHRELARHLDTHADALDALVIAADRDRFYMPLVLALDDEVGLVSGALLPTLSASREAAMLLIARAHRRVASGDMNGARRDLRAVARMAAHHSHGSSVIDILVALAIRDLGVKAYTRLATGNALTARQASQLRADLQSHPPLQPIWRSIDRSERAVYLDRVQHFIRDPDAVADLGKMPAIKGAVDWNEVLIDGNRYFDRLVKIMKMPDVRAAHRELALNDERMSKLRTTMDRTNPTEHMSKTLQLKILARLSPVRTIADRQATTETLADLALQLAEHKAKHSKFPTRLKDLAAYKTADSPIDPYNAKPLVYKPAEDGAGYVLYSIGDIDKNAGGIDDGEDGNIVVRVPQVAEKIER